MANQLVRLEITITTATETLGNPVRILRLLFAKDFRDAQVQECLAQVSRLTSRPARTSCLIKLAELTRVYKTAPESRRSTEAKRWGRTVAKLPDLVTLSNYGTKVGQLATVRARSLGLADIVRLTAAAPDLCAVVLIQRATNVHWSFPIGGRRWRERTQPSERQLLVSPF
jgi:hypothetical protein